MPKVLHFVKDGTVDPNILLLPDALILGSYEIDSLRSSRHPPEVFI